MRVAILSRGPHLYSTQSLLKAGEKRGHLIEVIDHVRCDLVIESGKPMVYYEGDRIDDLEAIIPRIGASVTEHGASVIKHFELMGVFTTARCDALLQARDKLRCLQKLSVNGVSVPKTVYVNNTQSVPFMMNQFGDGPVVIKLLSSTHGVGVILAENKKNAISIIEAFGKVKEKVIVQEFIKEASGTDIRAFIVGGEIVASMKRVAMPGEFRSNLHRGASGTIEPLSEIEKEVALRSAKVMGLDVAGVDLLRSNQGPLIMEVNASPGLEGIETITGQDVAGKIIEHMTRRAQKLKLQQRK